MNVEVLQQMLLCFYNLKSDVAFDGVQAVQMINESIDKTCCNSQYILVFMDYDMPNMNGAEATRLITKAKLLQNRRIYEQVKR